jgi:hypothetical protein
MAQEMTQAATSWDEMEAVSDGEADGGSGAGSGAGSDAASLGEAELNLLGEAAAAIVTQHVVHVDRLLDMFWFNGDFMSDMQVVLPLFDDRSESAGHIGVQIRIGAEVVPRDEELVRWTEWPVTAEQPSGLAYSRRMETQGRAHTRQRQQWRRCVATDTEDDATQNHHTVVGNVRVKMARFGELRVIMALQTRLLSPAGTGAGQHRVVSALVRVTKNETPMLSVDLLRFIEQARVFEVRTLEDGMNALRGGRDAAGPAAAAERGGGHGLVRGVRGAAGDGAGHAAVRRALLPAGARAGRGAGGAARGAARGGGGGYCAGGARADRGRGGGGGGARERERERGRGAAGEAGAALRRRWAALSVSFDS